eukprot:scaffold35622_cov47-Attheya_sp.AAC.1
MDDVHDPYYSQEHRRIVRGLVGGRFRGRKRCRTDGPDRPRPRPNIPRRTIPHKCSSVAWRARDTSIATVCGPPDECGGPRLRPVHDMPMPPPSLQTRHPFPSHSSIP